MNDLPLQPLVWIEDADSSVAQHEFIEYRIIPDHDSFGKFAVRYKDSRHHPATGFATIDEAKAWAWNHYNDKMQPYVKPMPTWIDASERLPEKHTTVLVVYHAHFDDEPITEFDVCTAFFDGKTFDPKDQLFYMKRNTTVVRWMPIPEFSTMQNNKGE